MAKWRWKKRQTALFQTDHTRRRYWCPHGRRKDACRECGGLKLAIRWMYYSAKARAKRDHIPCTITQDDLFKLVGNGCCPVLGIPYQFSHTKGRGGDDFSPSLDKFQPELGYVPENCFIISNLANRIKTSATVDQIQQVADWMKRVLAAKELTNV